MPADLERHDRAMASMGSGFWFGLLLSLVAHATWLFADWDSPARHAWWAVPVVFLGGLAMAGGQRRRFGTGLMLGAMAASVGALLLVWALLAALPYAWGESCSVTAGPVGSLGRMCAETMSPAAARTSA